MEIRSSGKCSKNEDKMLNISYKKCQKILGLAMEYVFMFQKILHSL